MSADAPIIASAVVIPPNATQPSPPHRKRRESADQAAPADDPEAPSSKRTRLAPASAQDEKSRSQRLFGSILGNLGRVAQDTRTKKRQEVDAKMQEKLRTQQEEEQADFRRSREVRDEERRVFAIHAAQIRRRNDSHMANFLSTRAKPKIYYRPWKLLQSQELTIQKQKEMAARNRSPSPSGAATAKDPPSLQEPEPMSPTAVLDRRDESKETADDDTNNKEDAVMKDDETNHDDDDDGGDDTRQDDSKTQVESKARDTSPGPNVQPGDEEEEMVEY
ncbi:hypothetical protein DRE_06748 [Drechslerella stenobrocha 248]|uniref:Pinin/SDK/MemA protein domain-containing protein n=1 Tax=Drechslerella stenobrocha 248 TaxID=1043628 RepID=W7I6P7_9PEZI|nr:hypothetical protein DRE_06748 [Drechslerella stenobrocha 248]